MSDQHHIYSREEEGLPDGWIIPFKHMNQLQKDAFADMAKICSHGGQIDVVARIDGKDYRWQCDALAHAKLSATDKPERLAECKADVEYWKHCAEFGSLSGKVALEQRIAECEQALAAKTVEEK